MRELGLLVIMKTLLYRLVSVSIEALWIYLHTEQTLRRQEEECLRNGVDLLSLIYISRLN